MEIRKRKNLKRLSKRAFTLLEIAIALVIISIIGALVSVQVKKLIDVHRFESEVANLFITLQDAQVLSAAYQTDISLDFSLNSDGALSYCFSSYEPFKSHQFNNQTVVLKHTKILKFNEAKQKSLHLDIFSGGRIEPRGILAFQQNAEGEGKALWFDLQYGQLLKFAYNKPLPMKQSLPVKPKF